MSGFRGFLGKLAMPMRRFMEGRYGNDKLNMAILLTGVVMSILSSILGGFLLKLILWAQSYGMMIWSIFRCLSRNTYKRYQ